MFLTRSEYDQGVVIAVEKRITSPLMEPSSIEKIVEIDRHIAVAMSGLTADSRTMIERARTEAQNYWFTYNEPMRTESVTQAVCNLAMQFGEGEDAEEHSMSRPFGVALLVAGVDIDGPTQTPVLFSTDPSGTYIQYRAKAIGSGSEGAQSALQEKIEKFENDSVTLAEAEKMVIDILKQVMEEKLSSTNVEVARITADAGYHLLSQTEVEALMASLDA
jgi:20S proteasome subunit alpha 5